MKAKNNGTCKSAIDIEHRDGIARDARFAASVALAIE